jgi:opacity protein-like surface antigen
MKLDKVGIIISLCVAIILYSAWIASAKEKSKTVNDGFYFGIMTVKNSMSGDFNNTCYYSSTTSTDIYDVPEVKNGFGFGVNTGYRINRASYEIAYQGTKHDTKSSFMFVGDSASYSVLDINFKYDLARWGRIRPYGLLGIGSTMMTVEDSTTDGVTIDDEEFRGICWNLGIGVAYYIHPKIAVTGGVISRWNTYHTVDFDVLKVDLKERTSGFSLGMTYTF